MLFAELRSVEDANVPNSEQEQEQEEDFDGVGHLGPVREPYEFDETSN